MAHNYYLKYSKDSIRLAQKAFAGGGEGNLYKIVSPAAYKGYVAKVYHSHKINKQREQKIDYLIENPPAGAHEQGAIIWIKDALYDARSNFVGFIMPFVKGKKLEVLCLGKLPRKLNSKWDRFDLKYPDALKYRLRIGFNLAAAIYQMHATDHYVLVDMKPENIIVQPNGLLSIVDTDSVEVIENGKAIFPAPVATPEYTPPEFYTDNYRKNDTVGESWDRFGLAAILYKLLFGIHPFTGASYMPYDHLVTLHQKIEAGLFVHSKIRKQYIKVIPPPHQQFQHLDKNLQELFHQCFDEGHAAPELRPTANEWCSALLLAIGDPKLEAHFAHILGVSGYHSGNKYVMPSALFRKRQRALDPELWIEQKIANLFESPPPLSPSLRHLIDSGTQEVKLSLGIMDYIGTILCCMAAWGLLGVFGYVHWIIDELWLESMQTINMVVIPTLIIVFMILPRMISFLRHLISPQVRLRKTWKRFRHYYPQLQKAVEQSKKQLLQQVQQNSQDQISTFQEQKNTFIDPLYNYLKERDLVVKKMLKARKEAFEKLIQSLTKKMEGNQVLEKIKGKNLADFDKQLDKTYKAIRAQLEAQTEQDLKKEQAYLDLMQDFDQKMDLIAQKDEKVQNKLMAEAMLLFDIEIFIEEKAKGTRMEEKRLWNLLKAKKVRNLLDISDIYFKDGTKTLVILLASGSYHGESIQLSEMTYSKGAYLIEAFKSFEEPLKMVKREDIEYGTEYFQVTYAPQKAIFEEERRLLKAAKDKKYKKLKKAALDKKLEDLSADHKQALALLEILKKEEAVEVERIEKTFEAEYQAIFSECEAKVDVAVKKLGTMNESFKIAVEKLINGSPVQKIKLNFDQKVKKAKTDLIRLEKLKMD